MEALREPSDELVEVVVTAIYDAATLHSSSPEVQKRWPWQRATDLHGKYRAIARAAQRAVHDMLKEVR